MKVVILQPPSVQLNTPYPSGAYLSAFFRRLADECRANGRIDSGMPEIESVEWIDMNIRLFHRLFCPEGLSLVFRLTAEKALAIAGEAGGETSFNVRRYVSQQDVWIKWIDVFVSVLENGDREAVHELVRSPHVPKGARMEAFLSSLGRDISADDCRLLATYAVEDIADYISAVFDSHFSLVHYASSLAADAVSFAAVERAVHSPVMENFLAPVAAEVFSRLKNGSAPESLFLFCLSLPFPGTVAPALFLGKMIGSYFGRSAVRVMGGGYVNTELRSLDEPRFFDYADFLSFDRGYGSYLALMDCAFRPEGRKLYKIRYRSGGPHGEGETVVPHTEDSAEDRPFREAEDRYTVSLIPDYSDIDFSVYPRLADDTNPMHRLWSDGAWLKAYLAHGCYWHRCAFCDVSLDYVRSYRPVDTTALYAGLYAQAARKGVYGVHFVDEASPPRALRDFAAENCRVSGRRLSFWGNIRFEKTFTRDLADFLCYGGLTGVSGGIEIATGDGLSAVDKGTDLASLVSVFAAFKEAGVLVHAYMIYGYWEETPQQLVDSMETLRQLFASDLLDSAFWHKFVLTRHSRLYHEWERGLHPALRPSGQKRSSFAENDLRFENEAKSQRYTEPLDAALYAWMRGLELERPVTSWFPFRMPAPSVPPDMVDSYIAGYEKTRDAAFAAPPSGHDVYVWLGGVPVVVPARRKGTAVIFWTYMGESFSAETDRKEAETWARALKRLAPEHTSGEPWASASPPGTDSRLFRVFRGRGLCLIK